jgi:glycosyltransferase involved in cell wall biosynthesis
MKPRLLILTPRFPYPVVGGDRLRIYQICLALAKQYQLTLLSFCETKHEMNMLPPSDGVFHSVERIFLPKWRSWLNCILALPGRLPLQVAYYRHSGFRRRALELTSEHDATLAHLIRVGDVIKDAPGVKFLEMTDAISLNYSRIRKAHYSNNDFRARVYALEAKRLHSYEKDIVDHFDHTFLVSEVDRQYLFGGWPDKLKRVNVFSLGVAVDTIPFQFDFSGQDIVFIGNMFSLQNFDAALFMASDILPLVRRERPNIRLRLIGRIRSEQAIQLARFDGVLVTGEVSNVAEAANGGGVGVCTLRLGAGCQFKILEYMALGLPVVSTSIGLEGYNARSGSELLLADDPKLFAEQILRLLNDRAFALSMAKAARGYVESHHKWEKMLDPMISIVQAQIKSAKESLD